ncbi:hypothetical protein BB561_004435 [Smittium simulii]|uniref:AAA+ ATPase domain-containing protein n=1 Tax=Smittium simulii TaxID=133385 RepID=A0A2T9YG87_9FUNG|nr:hypothetical protein BB561_004435 [Smittium simulii]
MLLYRPIHRTSPLILRLSYHCNVSCINSLFLKPYSQLVSRPLPIFSIPKNSHLYSTIAKTTTPLQIYMNAIQKNLIKKDPHQISVLQSLQNIYFEINDYLDNQTKSSKLRWMLEKVKLLKKTCPPMGLYMQVFFTLFILYGGVGTGKTTVMDMFYNSLETDLKKRVHFHSFMLEIHARLHDLKKQGLKSSNKQPITIVADEIASVTKILCFDEFQVIDIADAMLLRQLLTELFKKNVVIICTSNRHPDDLYKNGLQRESFLSTIELLKDNCIVQSLDTGTDYRRNHSSSVNLYISSQDPKSDAVLNSTFDHLSSLTAYPIIKNKKIHFLGRDLTIRQSSHDIGYMKFQDICQDNLSAADYIEIAKHYKVIILSNVPQLGAAERDQARRFITFIDSLYENQIVLVMSCEYDIFNLFNIMSFDSQKIDCNSTKTKSGLVTGEEERFAFDRTLSRLVEMRTKDYLNLVAPKTYLNFFLNFDIKSFNVDS